MAFVDRPHPGNGYKLLGRATLGIVAGVEYDAELWSTPHRARGRRIRVFDVLDRLAFDTDDCYDGANALNSLDAWEQKMRRAATCDVCKVAFPPGEGKLLAEARVCRPCSDKIYADAVPAEHGGSD